eukprot:CAMPEP_0116874994 /NCGR_PEP_ID=MMETSP0463-20121206/6683_1 /TAXON_ID=181622 /ORGANISM="Strombidinopsis sp, Strain SopsisLIS2011" /LENGTH=52 /DNA_ID=CAMNT_0004519649 /DNA_START=446 /DNA_END=604 /DNA_ORIENTATION=-
MVETSAFASITYSPIDTPGDAESIGENALGGYTNLQSGVTPYSFYQASYANS